MTLCRQGPSVPVAKASLFSSLVSRDFTSRTTAETEASGARTAGRLYQGVTAVVVVDLVVVVVGGAVVVVVVVGGAVVVVVVTGTRAIVIWTTLPIFASTPAGGSW